MTGAYNNLSNPASKFDATDDTPVASISCAPPYNTTAASSYSGYTLAVAAHDSAARRLETIRRAAFHQQSAACKRASIPPQTVRHSAHLSPHFLAPLPLPMRQSRTAAHLSYQSPLPALLHMSRGLFASSTRFRFLKLFMLYLPSLSLTNGLQTAFFVSNNVDNQRLHF